MHPRCRKFVISKEKVVTVKDLLMGKNQVRFWLSNLKAFKVNHPYSM